ncbi:MAG TPA: VOC family protein [Trueperaceae bacterium]|nr:VOC family protein [Trueperaceae bacterium]
MLRIGSIVWGVRDVARAVEFWTAALDYRARVGDDPDWVMLKPRRGTGVQLALQQVKADPAERRRHHLDLYAYDQTAEVERLVGLGARRVPGWRYEDGSDFVVLSDPDGNYFCVIAAGEAARDPGLRPGGTRYVTQTHDLPAPDEFAYRGARVLIALHEKELRAFLPVWRRFDASGIQLPRTDDEDYVSNGHLLVHVLRASGRYLTWACRQLGLPDPEIAETPAPPDAAEHAEEFLEHVLSRWRGALAEVPAERFEDKAYVSNWGAPMTIESMLEHAFTHPARHTFQLEELMARRTSS